MKHFVIATAGHVDHGKSSLVKALTGTDPDRLPEEKARQITIDLGFAELNLRGPDGAEIHAAIVDVPGHEDFVRNMIAGVGSIDLALLVVAADDGWMPQTEEHLQILQYLGVRRAVIALTKIDIGNGDETELQVREQLRGSDFADIPIVRSALPAGSPNLTALSSQVSTRGLTPGGLAALKAALATALSEIEAQRDIGKPRLFVDRAFSLRGVGTVVTGTLMGGTLRVGDVVVVQARNVRARIRSLQSHGRDVDVAQPGTRTAVNLPDLAVSSGVARGDVVTLAGFDPSTTIDVVLHRSPRVRRAAPIKSGASAWLHHGTTRVLTKIVLLEQETPSGGESAIAQLRLSTPILAFVGDHFVIRDASEQHTIAGGIVLDVDSPREDLRSPAQITLLTTRSANHEDVDLYTKTEIARRGATASSQLLKRSHFCATAVAEALQRLHQRREIFLGGNIAADAVVWRELRTRAIYLIDTAHRTHPERAGLELNELRSALSERSSEVVDALIVDLCRDDFTRVGSSIARRSHHAALPAALQAIAKTLRERVSANPFDPPPRKQLAPDAETQQALKFLIEHSEIVEISDDVILSRHAFEKMKTEIAALISNDGAATVSRLRSTLKSSRRVMVPLLERLDREGFTRRSGDERTLAQEVVPTATSALD
jgi:selenocysteine-specific elongation factor